MTVQHIIMIFLLYFRIVINVIILVIHAPDQTLMIADHVMLHGIGFQMDLEAVYAQILFSMMELVNYALLAIIHAL